MERPLGERREGAHLLDLVTEQLDAERLAPGAREDVDDSAAHRELAAFLDPVDALVYILAQLSGGVLGALLVKAFLLDEGRASHYGAATISPLLSGNVAGACIEGIGTFLLVLAVCAVAFNPRARHEWAPLAIGLTLGLDVMIFGPLTGSAVNPARWFGPALIGNEFGGTWPYLVGPIVGALAAAALYRFVIAGGQYALGPEPPTEAGEVVENVAADVETVGRPRRK